MLDQNTDRMWYVIGAVIIGAAIIFILNGTMPQLFASVGDTFTKKTEETTTIVDGIRPNTGMTSIYDKDVHLSSYPVVSKLVGYDADKAEWELAIPYNSIGWSGGLTIRDNVVEIPWGATFTLSYDVWSPIDTFASNDVNNVPVKGAGWGPYTNDFDDYTDRVNVGENRGVNKLPQNAIAAGEWTTITFAYHNTNPLNTEKMSLYDYSTFGAHNPTDDPIHIKIKNVKAMVTLSE